MLYKHIEQLLRSAEKHHRYTAGGGFGQRLRADGGRKFAVEGGGLVPGIVAALVAGFDYVAPKRPQQGRIS